MSTKRFWIASLACLGGVAFLTWFLVRPLPLSNNPAPIPVPQMRLPLVDAYHRGKDRAALLKQNGFVEVPLMATNAGYLDVVAQVNGANMLFYLDTGSMDTIVDEAVAERRKLPSQISDRFIGGLGGKTKPLRRFETDRFVIGGLQRKFATLLKDMTSLVEPLVSRNDPADDGLLGTDFLFRRDFW